MAPDELGGDDEAKTRTSLPHTALKWLEQVFADAPTVEVAHYHGLTAHYCREINARYLLRGLRNASDFDYEKTISQLNTIVGDGIETVFLISRPEYGHVSSTIVREIIKGGGDAQPFLPKALDMSDWRSK